MCESRRSGDCNHPYSVNIKWWSDSSLLVALTWILSGKSLVLEAIGRFLTLSCNYFTSSLLHWTLNCEVIRVCWSVVLEAIGRFLTQTGTSDGTVSETKQSKGNSPEAKTITRQQWRRWPRSWTCNLSFLCLLKGKLRELWRKQTLKESNDIMMLFDRLWRESKRKNADQASEIGKWRSSWRAS